MVVEVKGFGEFSALADELHAVFFDEAALLHFGEHFESFENPVGFGDERLSDVKSGEAFPFEDFDVEPLLGDERGDGGTGGSGPDDDDIGVGVNGRLNHGRDSSLLLPGEGGGEIRGDNTCLNKYCRDRAVRSSEEFGRDSAESGEWSSELKRELSTRSK